MSGKIQKKNAILCLCNGISKQAVVSSIREGARNFDEVFDKTGAGVGPCGGSCRKLIRPLFEKTHPESPPEKT